MASRRKTRKARRHEVGNSKRKRKKPVKRAKRNTRPKRKRRRPARRKIKPAALAVQLKKAKKQLTALRKKLKQARVNRRVQLLKQRAKRRRDVPKNIKLLPGLDEHSRRQLILGILSTANDSDEYWELVQQIADELEITTYLVASVASPPRGGVFSVAA